MQTMRTIMTAVLVLATTLPAMSFSADIARPPAATGQMHLFTVVNATLDSVTGLAMASARSDAFEEVTLGEALRGGLASATVHVPDGGCLRDIRVTFLNGRTQVFPSIDVCRSRTLRLSTGRQPAPGEMPGRSE